MEIGLTIKAVYENGVIYTKQVLDVDEEQFMKDLNNAISWGLNLSCEVAFLTTQNDE